jgi:glycosyltransferase involved in cell wall biosynthesis
LWANLVAGFRDRGYDAHLVALYPDEEGEQQTPIGIDWDYVLERRPKDALGGARMIGSLARKLRSQAPAAIITALPAANVAVPLAVTAGRIRTKVITTHHTPSQTYAPRLDAADAVTGRLPCVHRIVTVSDAVANSLSNKSPAYRSKLTTIRNAVPPDIEDALGVLAGKRQNGNPRKGLLVCSGRLAEQKNYPVILRALGHLPDVTLDIVGAGPEETPLRALAEEVGVTNRVNFIGQKTRLETLEIVSQGDIFVQTSLFEGNSLSLIEAAKLGLPLIVSDVPEQREGITDRAGVLCGLIVPTHDHRALAGAIRRLFESPQEYQCFADHSARLGSEYQFRNVISSYEDLAC